MVLVPRLHHVELTIDVPNILIILTIVTLDNRIEVYTVQVTWKHL